MKAELTDGTPPGKICTRNISGCIKLDVFVQRVDHFLAHAKPNVKDSAMLILVGKPFKK
jgi:hypothetical protein